MISTVLDIGVIENAFSLLFEPSHCWSQPNLWVVLRRLQILLRASVLQSKLRGLSGYFYFIYFIDCEPIALALLNVHVAGSFIKLRRSVIKLGTNVWLFHVLRIIKVHRFRPLGWVPFYQSVPLKLIGLGLSYLVFTYSQPRYKTRWGEILRTCWQCSYTRWPECHLDFDFRIGLVLLRLLILVQVLNFILINHPVVSIVIRCLQFTLLNKMNLFSWGLDYKFHISHRIFPAQHLRGALVELKGLGTDYLFGAESIVIDICWAIKVIVIIHHKKVDVLVELLLRYSYFGGFWDTRFVLVHGVLNLILKHTFIISSVVSTPWILLRVPGYWLRAPPGHWLTLINLHLRNGALLILRRNFLFMKVLQGLLVPLS